MSSERYVVLGLARPRAGWFQDLTRWATTAALPVEFVKCLSPEEARARLASGRRWSALLLDASVHGVDRDLIDAARSEGSAVVVVADPRIDRPWSSMGAAAVLNPQFSRDELLATLAEHTRPVARVSPHISLPEMAAPAPWRGRLVAVTGPGGTGASTVAAMLAQGLADDVGNQGLVVLADLALHADQAILHDAGDVMPGLPELVEAHRLGTPDSDEIRALTFDTGPRRYDLLLGLRQHRDWTTLRPRAVVAALHGLRRSYQVVVADIDSDLEGERQTGSTDIEDRNLLTLATVDQSDAVVAVGHPGPAGLYRLARLIHDLVAEGVPPQRILPLVNRGPRSAKARSEISEAVSRLAGPSAVDVSTPITLPYRRKVEDTARLGGRWSDSSVRTVHRAVTAVLDRAVDQRSPASGAPEPIRPGELGHYHPNIAEDTA